MSVWERRSELTGLWGSEGDPTDTGLKVKASPGRYMTLKNAFLVSLVAPDSNENPEFEF